jgi:hypothetical protein
LTAASVEHHSRGAEREISIQVPADISFGREDQWEAGRSAEKEEYEWRRKRQAE